MNEERSLNTTKIKNRLNSEALINKRMKKLENLCKAKNIAKEINDPEELKKHQIESLD